MTKTGHKTNWSGRSWAGYDQNGHKATRPKNSFYLNDLKR